MALQVKKRYPVPHKSRSHEKLPQRVLRREKRKRTTQRTITSVLIMVTIAVVGGIIYTWYTGQQKIASTTQSTAIGTPRAVFKPPKISSSAKVGVAVQTVSSSAKRGENAAITVRTNPEASCKIVVKYNKVPATDSGLIPKVADEFGMVSWAWTIAPGAPVGKWPIEVSCSNKTYSGVVVNYLVVE